MFEDIEKERDMSLVLIVFALLCGSDDQESVPVMSHKVLAAYDVSADIIYAGAEKLVRMQVKETSLN